MRQRVELVMYKGNWYHPNFFTRRKRCTARGVCLHCGKKRGEGYVTDAGRIEKVVIQAAHRDHDPRNGRAVLIPLCKQCHMSYDHQQHIRTQRRKDREAQIAIGQLVGWWFEKKRGKKIA